MEAFLVGVPPGRHFGGRFGWRPFSLVFDDGGKCFFFTSCICASFHKDLYEAAICPLLLHCTCIIGSI